MRGIHLERKEFVMKKDYKKLFGETMRTARMKQGITHRELAEIVGVSAVYSRDIEKGKYAPTWIIWLKICSVLHIDIDEVRKTYVAAEVREVAQTMGKKL